MSTSNGTERAPLKAGIVADFREERWPSMDLVAAMLARELPTVGAAGPIEPRILRPRFLRPLTQSSRLANSRGAYNAERALNRYVCYPLWLRRRRNNFGVFHIVDHSYAHLVNYLPAERTIVTCHDLDAFRCLLEPACEPRAAAFRAITRQVMRGLRSAARVICVSNATRDALLRAGLRSEHDTIVIPNGVDAPMFAEPDERARMEVDAMLGARAPDAIEILHVGSVERRKRIDLVVRIFAALAKHFPRARLIRVGGPLPPEYAELARELGITDRIVTLPFIEREVLAAVYGRASLVILPSDDEGFGMPMLEALAAGAPVLASDIGVLREVGGDAARYAATGDIDSWVAAAAAILRDADGADSVERQHRGIERARRFSWRENASRTVAIYEAIAERAQAPARATDASTNSCAANNSRSAATLEPVEAWNPPHEGR